MTSRLGRSLRAIVGTLCAISTPALALGDETKAHYDTEPRLGSEPRVMREPGEVVDVIDAADDRDPFDIDFSLGFGFTSKRASITHGSTSFGTFTETTARLFPRVDLGLYKDLAFYGALPIVLSDSRSISSATGSSSGLFGPRGDAIATFPFRSPNRSGADHLALGIDAGIMNQARHPKQPTWMVGAEVELPIGSSLHACNAAPRTGQVVCASPFDRNRNGKQNSGEPANVAELPPGVGRGAVGVEIHTYLSRRVHYVEPYGGLRGLVEIPIGSSDLALAAKAGGGQPPVEVGAALGTLFIPWENREHFGRLTFDVRGDFILRSAGADHSEVFDLLGSSDYGALRTASYTGITRVAAYPTGKLGSTAIWQSSRYVKLALGVSLAYAGDHRIAEAGSSAAASPPFITQNSAETLGVKGDLSFDLGARGVVMF